MLLENLMLYGFIFFWDMDINFSKLWIIYVFWDDKLVNLIFIKLVREKNVL